MDLLMRFLEFTAKEMSPPKAYGTFHLLFWSIGLLLSFLIAFLLRKTKEKADKYLLFGIGIFLLLAEIYKQLFYTFYIGKGNYQFDSRRVGLSLLFISTFSFQFTTTSGEEGLTDSFPSSFLIKP